MQIVLEEGFLRAWERANPEDQTAVARVLAQLRSSLADPGRHSGLGIRKLHPFALWEVRVGLDGRALFLHRAGRVVFVFLGSHNEVQRFLRSYRD